MSQMPPLPDMGTSMAEGAGLWPQPGVPEKNELKR